MKSRFNPETFRDVIQHEDDLNGTLRAVGLHEPTHVIAGFESGVELAEWLGGQLGLRANDPMLREARRDKFLMTEAVRSQGMRTAVQFRSSDIDEIVAWKRRTLDWPVIVKPLKSVASDHVFCCRSDDDMKQASETILSGANILGSRNSAVLVQEFLDGIEYAVDTVSLDARSKVTAIWQYDRPDCSCDFVSYNAMKLLEYAGEIQDSLRSFAFHVLRALGVCFGPAHCELMWVDGAPVFIELGARLSAGINATLSRICGGICQLDETVNAILAPDDFLATLDVTPGLEKRAANVFLIPRRRGTLIRTRHLEELQSLPTLHSMSVASRPGVALQRVAGLVTLVDHDTRAIDRDIEVIRARERDGMFEIVEQLQV
jgi:hypothetical protein